MEKISRTDRVLHGKISRVKEKENLTYNIKKKG